MDDILIFATTIEELRKTTFEVLEILQKNDLFAKPEKCIFETQEVKFLGLVIKPGTLHMATDKLSGISEWPTPTTVKHIHQFLGFCNFYRRFIPDFATKAHPLNELTRANVPWKWDETQQFAFETLKDTFQTQPTLLLPDPTKPFTLETNASLVGTGAVLYQKNEQNKLQPCGYISHALNPAQQRYEVYDRELLALVSSLKHLATLPPS